MRGLKNLFVIFFTCVIAVSSAAAQMTVEVGGKVEGQLGLRGREATFPFLIPNSIREEVSVLPGNVDHFAGKSKNAIATDSLFDIWATGTYDYECLGPTTYGAKIELFADPTDSKYSMPLWQLRSFSEATVPHDRLRYIPAFFPNFAFIFFSGDFFVFDIADPGPAREVKIFMENKFGKLEIGDTIGATKHLQVNAATIAVGSGGIAGDARLWATPLTFLGMFGSADMITNKVAYYYVDTFFAPLVNNVTFTPLAPPEPFSLLGSATFDGVSTEMRYTGKISYYTPRYKGFVIGGSYMPDTDIYGSVAQLANVSRDSSPFGMGFKNVIEGGINYDCKIEDIGIKAAIAGEFGKNKAKEIATLNYNADGTLNIFGTPTDLFPGSIPALLLFPKAKDLRAYEFGLGLDYCGFAIAGSYGVNKRLLEGLKDNKYWTLGAAYTYDDFGISVNYLDNRQKSEALKNQHQTIPGGPLTIVDVEGGYTKLKYNTFVADVEYKICDGLIPYISYAYFDVHQPYSATLQSKFKQSVGLIGVRVLF